VTFHVKTGLNDPEFANFKTYYDYQAKDPNTNHNAWIIKPGEATNCGHGISVAKDYNEIKGLV
jgi:hypothetical protein